MVLSLKIKYAETFSPVGAGGNGNSGSFFTSVNFTSSTFTCVVPLQLKSNCPTRIAVMYLEAVIKLLATYTALRSAGQFFYVAPGDEC